MNYQSSPNKPSYLFKMFELLKLAETDPEWVIEFYKYYDKQLNETQWKFLHYAQLMLKVRGKLSVKDL